MSKTLPTGRSGLVKPWTATDNRLIVDCQGDGREENNFAKDLLRFSCLILFAYQVERTVSSLLEDQVEIFSQKSDTDKLQSADEINCHHRR